MHDEDPAKEPLPFETLTRVTFRSGQLITADDLNGMVHYLRERLKRHNRLCHGRGILTGLNLALTPEGGLKLSAGVALDREGNEIVLAQDAIVPIPDTTAARLTVGVGYAEIDKSAAPTLSDGDAPKTTRVQETGRIVVTPDPPSFDANLVICGALVRAGTAWQVDMECRQLPHKLVVPDNK